MSEHEFRPEPDMISWIPAIIMVAAGICAILAFLLPLLVEAA